MAKQDFHNYVIPLSQHLAAEMGYEWIDAELVKEGPGRYLRVYLDKPNGISLDDCERYHRAIQPRLETIDYDFLEISSPGVDRPLKNERDFAKAMGGEIEVKLYKPLDGAKVYQGMLIGYDEEGFTIRTTAGDRPFLRRDAALIKPVLVFEDEEELGEP